MTIDKPEAAADDKPILIYATVPGIETAEALAAALVDRRMVACANIIPGMVSIYEWKGTRQRDAEVVMLLKTRRGLMEAVIATIEAEHPYETPAIIAVDVCGGSLQFFSWILAQTRAIA